MEYHKARREVLFISVQIHGYGVLTQDYFAFARSFPGLATGVPLSWLLCPPDSMPSLSAHVYSFPSTFLLSGTARPWSSAGTSHFSEEPWFLLLGEGIRNQALGPRYLLLLGNHSFQGPSDPRARRHMCSSLPMYIYTHIYKGAYM